MNHFKSGHVRFGTQRRRAILCDLMRRRLERSNLFLHYVDGAVSCSAVYVSQFDPRCAATKPLVSNAAVSHGEEEDFKEAKLSDNWGVYN